MKKIKKNIVLFGAKEDTIVLLEYLKKNICIPDLVITLDPIKTKGKYHISGGGNVYQYCIDNNIKVLGVDDYSLKSTKFTNLKFDGNNNIVINGLAFSDQDILNFISNLNSKPLIAQASLTNMKEETQDENSSSKNMKGFTINCILKGN